jgi:hypothetical protein
MNNLQVWRNLAHVASLHSTILNRSGYTRFRRPDLATFLEQPDGETRENDHAAWPTRKLTDLPHLQRTG